VVVFSLEALVVGVGLQTGEEKRMPRVGWRIRGDSLAVCELMDSVVFSLLWETQLKVVLTLGPRRKNNVCLWEMAKLEGVRRALVVTCAGGQRRQRWKCATCGAL